MAEQFSCYKVTRQDDQVQASVVEIGREDLPPGDVLIRVAYSSLNYKDGLASMGHPGVARRLPHVPGIDAAGMVEQSSDARFQPGAEVLVTGFGLGQDVWGGYSQYIRVPAGWVVPLPTGLSLRESMIYGTAGFTAAISVESLQAHGMTPERGEVLVTGASGGVGSLAVAILAKLGYRVVASSGKATSHEFLKGLGAAAVISREEVDDRSNKPLLGTRWAGAVDTVGGNTLATVLRTTARHGCVAACGLVGGIEMSLTVYPFILRGVVLAGIDSAEYPIERRASLWEKLAGEWKPSQLESLVANTVDLQGLDREVQEILAGRVQGRVLVKP